MKIAKATHRKSGFASSWQKKYPWLVMRIAVYCKLCIWYGHLPRKCGGKWVEVGGTSLRHDKLLKRASSAMHRDAEICRQEEEARASLT